MKCPDKKDEKSGDQHPKSNKSGKRKPYLDAKYVEKVIILSGQCGQALGLSLAGGVTDRFRLPCFIQMIVQNSVSKMDGRLKPGDFLVDCNGKSLLEMSLIEVTEILRNACQPQHPTVPL